METTQFAMVEELASLIKDNLSCKHLVLSVEEALVNFLQDDTSSDGILELQPMGPYHRLLLHRLADIYGFAHESVGEGDYRHLVLERCADTTIPPILVSDILWQYDEHQTLSASNYVLLRNEAPALKTTQQLSPAIPLEEREASYQAARARIFSLHEDGEQDLTAPKSRKVPVVARRMIAHALGQRISPTSSTEKLSLNESEKEVTGGLSSDEGKNLCPKVEDIKESTAFSTGKLGSHGRKKYDKMTHGSSGGRSHNSDGHNEVATGVSAKNNLLPNSRNRRAVGVEDLEKLHIGAARRIFAHALGLPSGKGNLETMVKSNEGNRDFKRETEIDDQEVT